MCVEIINPPAHLLKPGKHNTETVTSKIKTALSNINTIQLLWREKRNIVVTGRHTYSDFVRSWGKKREILTRLAKKSVIRQLLGREKRDINETCHITTAPEMNK